MRLTQALSWITSVTDSEPIFNSVQAQCVTRLMPFDLVTIQLQREDFLFSGNKHSFSFCDVSFSKLSVMAQ